jgi:hypothetical protein
VLTSKLNETSSITNLRDFSDFINKKLEDVNRLNEIQNIYREKGLVEGQRNLLAHFSD